MRNAGLSGATGVAVEDSAPPAVCSTDVPPKAPAPYAAAPAATSEPTRTTTWRTRSEGAGARTLPAGTAAAVVMPPA
ncbi:Uncharacterised protein [Mycobacteroides abscessus]|nr:Uncharacterised protein [Mycobacteroides abscessus]